MSIFEIYKLEVANRLEFGPTIKDAEVRCLLEAFLDVCKEGMKLEAENVNLRENVAELEKSLIELVKMEVSLPECAVCWDGDQCTDLAHGYNCLAVRAIIDTAKEAAKEAGHE